jgi:hypothetical protein
MSIKINPEDCHIMISHSWHSMKIFDGHGNLLLKSVALTSGTGGGVDSVGGDTPFGDYQMTSEAVETAPDDHANMAVYGPWFLGLWDMEGQESSRGRAGIGMHCGRQGAYAYPGAGPHELEPTHGCIRVLEEDMVNTIVPLRHKTLVAGGRVIITVGP